MTFISILPLCRAIGLWRCACGGTTGGPPAPRRLRACRSAISPGSLTGASRISGRATCFTLLNLELTPEDFSGSVRLRGQLQGAEVALWGFGGFDTFPEFKMDPDLAAVLSLITMMGETPLIEQLTPDRLEALERFQGKLMQARAQNDGSSLLTSTFHRLAQLGVQARRSFGPYVLALESAWTPRFMGGRTLFDLMMQPIPGLATLHTALRIEYQSPPGLVAVLGVSDFAVFDVPNKPLMLLDTGF